MDGAIPNSIARNRKNIRDHEFVPRAETSHFVGRIEASGPFSFSISRLLRSQARMFPTGVDENSFVIVVREARFVLKQVPAPGGFPEAGAPATDPRNGMPKPRKVPEPRPSGSGLPRPSHSPTQPLPHGRGSMRWAMPLLMPRHLSVMRSSSRSGFERWPTVFDCVNCVLVRILVGRRGEAPLVSTLLLF